MLIEHWLAGNCIFVTLGNALAPVIVGVLGVLFRLASQVKVNQLCGAVFRKDYVF